MAWHSKQFLRLVALKNDAIFESGDSVRRLEAMRSWLPPLTRWTREFEASVMRQLVQALQDPDAVVRYEALTFCNGSHVNPRNRAVVAAIRRLATNDPSPNVRELAVDRLMSLGDEQTQDDEYSHEPTHTGQGAC